MPGDHPTETSYLWPKTTTHPVPMMPNDAHGVGSGPAGGLVAKGSAEPYAIVRLYLNQADLAEAKTQSDGRWSLTIQHGLQQYGLNVSAVSSGSAAAPIPTSSTCIVESARSCGMWRSSRS